MRSGGDGPSEEYLAPVRYLFGAAPSERDTAAVDEPAVGEPAVDEPAGGAEVGGAETTSAPAASSGWYVEPEAERPHELDVPPVVPARIAPRALRAVPALRDADAETETTSGPALAADAGRAARGPTAEDVVAATAASRVFFTETDDAESSATAGSRAGRAAKTPRAHDADEPAAPKGPAVRTASINALARKGMSSAEMVRLLEAREIDPDEAAAEVERLERVGLLDDRVLAADLVQRLQERKGLGRSAINAELRRRLLDQAAIDEALEAVDTDDELARCMEIANKRASQLRSYDRDTAERRLSAFLMRRGYAGSVVGAAVSAALGPAGPRFR